MATITINATQLGDRLWEIAVDDGVEHRRYHAPFVSPAAAKTYFDGMANDLRANGHAVTVNTHTQEADNGTA